MIIVGAGGHATEVLDILTNEQKSNCYFFDDYSKNTPAFIKNIPVCKSIDDLKLLISKNSSFVVATGNVKLRNSLAEKLIALGGELTTVTSSLAFCSDFNTVVGSGTNIMAYVFVSNNVKIGEGCLINTRAHLHHNVTIGNYCEVSPGAVLLGNVTIGNFVTIGAGAILLPGITVSNNAIIGAGAVVTKNVTAGKKVVGNPAKEI